MVQLLITSYNLLLHWFCNSPFIPCMPIFPATLKCQEAACIVITCLPVASLCRTVAIIAIVNKNIFSSCNRYLVIHSSSVEPNLASIATTASWLVAARTKASLYVCHPIIHNVNFSGLQQLTKIYPCFLGNIIYVVHLYSTGSYIHFLNIIYICLEIQWLQLYVTAHII